MRIAFGDDLGHSYEPPCVRVAVGDVVRFEGPFGTHPLVPGSIEDGLPSEDADGANPVPEVQAGQTAEFVAGRPGRFGYYCDLHVAEGMLGAIEVVAAAPAGERP